MTKEDIYKLTDISTLNISDKIFVFLFGYGDITKYYNLTKYSDMLYNDFLDMYKQVKYDIHIRQFIDECSKYFPQQKVKATRIFNLDLFK